MKFVKIIIMLMLVSSFSAGFTEHRLYRVCLASHPEAITDMEVESLADHCSGAVE